MFDTIILLAGQAEHVAMPPVLRAHNPQLSIISIATSADLAAVDADLRFRSNGAAENIPAAAIGRSATFRSTYPRMSSNGA
ncbi:hypothetical protein [Bradyrhizobium sp.]|uniref:hypothetical protein n=1 Tax=Bradyrhizobium sp. TaxID=376 RepID=UPI0025BF315F|nr:hypothetical protein [Bradyrhizobium sp.]